MLTVILNALKAIITQIEGKISGFWQDLEQAFPAASQAAIADMAPLALQIVSDLNGQTGLDGKQVASLALSQLETSLMAAGKTFVIAEATGAIAIAMGKTGTSTAVTNGGSLPGGVQAPAAS